MSAQPPPTPQLKVTDLFAKRQQRDAARLKAYNEILRLMYHKIEKAAEIQDHPPSILYTVPPFILGLPKLDLEDCIVYLVHMLRQNGFQVRYTFPNLLAVSWAHHEHAYLTKQNPIIQAMKPATKPASTPAAAGKKRGVSFAPGPAAALPSPFNPFGDAEKERAPPRNPGEYIPPAAFLNSVERPVKSDAAGSQLAKLWM